MNKKLVVFDFFGVFCPDVADVWMDGLLEEEKIRELRKSFYPLGDSGKLTAEEFFATLEKESGVPAAKIFDDWMDIAVPNEKVIDIVKELKEKRPDTKVILLSNAVAMHLAAIFDKFEIHDLFHKCIVSANYGMCKPNPDFFKLALETMGVDACDAVMIDDRESNLESARGLGMSGILFKNAEELRRELGL